MFCDDIPSAVKCASVSRWDCRKRTRLLKKKFQRCEAGPPVEERAIPIVTWQSPPYWVVGIVGSRCACEREKEGWYKWFFRLNKISVAFCPMPVVVPHIVKHLCIKDHPTLFSQCYPNLCIKDDPNLFSQGYPNLCIKGDPNLLSQSWPQPLFTMLPQPMYKSWPQPLVTKLTPTSFHKVTPTYV